MKNKEIEYLLNEMKDTTQDYIGTNGCKYQDLLREEIDLLLSYIEQLKKENQQLKENYDRIYNENCKLREEHNITDISLLDENQQLKKQKDDVVELIIKLYQKEYNKTSDWWLQEELCNNFDDMNIFTDFELERMLGEIDD